MFGRAHNVFGGATQCFHGFTLCCRWVCQVAGCRVNTLCTVLSVLPFLVCGGSTLHEATEATTLLEKGKTEKQGLRRAHTVFAQGQHSVLRGPQRVLEAWLYGYIAYMARLTKLRRRKFKHV